MRGRYSTCALVDLLERCGEPSCRQSQAATLSWRNSFCAHAQSLGHVDSRIGTMRTLPLLPHLPLRPRAATYNIASASIERASGLGASGDCRRGRPDAITARRHRTGLLRCTDATRDSYGNQYFLSYSIHPNENKNRREFLRASIQAAGAAAALNVMPAGIRQVLAIPARTGV